MLNVIKPTQETRTPAEDQARIFKALNDPARIAILNHLRDDGLIQDPRDGWIIFYRISAAQIFGLSDSSMASPDRHLPRSPI